MSIKRIIIYICIITGILTVQSSVIASFELPENVRIGLYFSNSALDNVNVASETGFIIGYNSETLDNYELLHKSDINNIKLSKPEYYYHLKGFEADTLKTYFIDLGLDFPNYDMTIDIKQNLISSGFETVTVYTGDIFKIWIGAYKTHGDAQNSISMISEASETGNCIIVQPSSKAILVSNDDDIIMIFDSDNKYLTVKPIPQKDAISLININGTNYRGHMELRRTEGSDMTVINIVDFNEYLYGVVPGEMPAFWHTEALKAQAVAARTYAVNNLNKYRGLGFNMCNTTASQVYNGYNAEHINTTNAIMETKNEIIRYEGQPAKVYYSSSSGGHTEDIRNVWGGPEVPYLKGVEDAYERTEEASRGVWRNEVSAEQLTEILNNKGYNIGKVIDILAEEYSASGRVTRLKIIGTQGEATLENYSTCTILGPSVVNSQKYTIERSGRVYVKSIEPALLSQTLVSVKNAYGLSEIDMSKESVNIKGVGGIQEIATVADTFVFEGRGWGHGVGLSQWERKEWQNRIYI